VAPLPAFDAYKVSRIVDQNQDNLRAATNSGLLNIMREKVMPAPTSQPTRRQHRRAGQSTNDTRAFFIDRLKTTQAWNRVFALALFTVNDRRSPSAHGHPRILLSLPLIIFLMAYSQRGPAASSIFRYESAGIALHGSGRLALHPARKPLLISLMGFSLLVQIYYAFLYSRGLWMVGKAEG